MQKEPAFRHDYQSRTGVLLINLGTPEAPTAKALRPYLKQFLSDPRVIEIPRLVWLPILHGFILPFRPRKSAEKYASIWQSGGSPLLLHTRQQTALLQQKLTQAGHGHLQVEFAMRYGQPSVASVIDKMRSNGVERLLVIPLYPQYAASSAGTALDDVFRHLNKLRNMPEVRTVRHFHDHPLYIEALAQQVEQHWANVGRGDKLLMSFHGVPKFTHDKGDPYFCECQKTGRLLAERLELAKDQYEVCFQSRFGRAEWLKPYAAETLANLGKAGTAKLDVICPGFVSDCLETLEEIAMEGKEIFLTNGGGEYRYIPCLNEQDTWIQTLESLVMQHSAGWESTSAQSDSRKEHAMQFGAKC